MSKAFDEIDRQQFNRWKKSQILQTRIRNDITELSKISTHDAFGVIELMRQFLNIAWVIALIEQKKDKTNDLPVV